MTHVAPPPPGLETRAAMRRALAAGRIGTWHWDIASDAVLWDGALCVIYGLSPAEAPKTAPDFLGLVIPEDRDATVRAVSHALEGAASVEHRFRASVGERTFWIHDRAHVIRDRDARPTSVIGMCCDIASDPNAGIVPFPGSLGDRRPVDLAVYLGTMVESLRQIGGTGRLDYEAIPAPCRFDRAVKLGLILMELAAPVGMAAETRPDRRIRVTLKSGARSARLEVADSEGHVIDDIGIESATALTRQIDGTLASDDAPGLGRQWRVDFPLPDVTA
ncbi:MAG TPA: PAS domain-containing protein [Dongiaceae bacterium]|nr:PAS domain-containing protein [Dongiaceae bacterium]